jgi:hypothetical protein
MARRDQQPGGFDGRCTAAKRGQTLPRRSQPPWGDRGKQALFARLDVEQSP